MWVSVPLGWPITSVNSWVLVMAEKIGWGKARSLTRRLLHDVFETVYPGEEVENKTPAAGGRKE